MAFCTIFIPLSQIIIIIETNCTKHVALFHFILLIQIMRWNKFYGSNKILARVFSQLVQFSGKYFTVRCCCIVKYFRFRKTQIVGKMANSQNTVHNYESVWKYKKLKLRLENRKNMLKLSNCCQKLLYL